MSALLGQAVLELSTDSSRYSTEIDRARQQAQGLDGSLGHTGRQSNTLGQRLRSLGGNVAGLGGRFARLAQGMKPAILGLGAMATAAVHLGMKFDAELSKIEGLVGVTSDELEIMRQGVLALAPAIGKGPQELAEALFFVTSAGFRGAEAMAVLEASAQASVAGLGDTATIADAVTSAINAYGAANLDAATATGILVAAVREGKAEASEIAGALGAVLPIASELGISFDQVAATVAAMTRSGLNASESATALRATMSSLLNPTSDAEKALEEYGLTSAGLRRQIREEGLLAVLSTLRDTFGDNETAITRVFGNVRALTGVLNLTGASADDTRAIFAALAAATGDDLANAYAVAAETGQNKLARAMAAIQSSAIALSDALMPILLPALEFVAAELARLPEIVRQVTFIFDNLGTAIDVLGDRAVAAVAAMVEGIADWLVARFEANVVAPVTGLIDDISGAFEGLWRDVVGNSYVPDMIDAIESEFGRLDAIMVEPTTRATGEVSAAWGDVETVVADGLDRLDSDLRRGALSWESFASVAVRAIARIVEAQGAGGGGFNLGSLLPSISGSLFGGSAIRMPPPRGLATGGRVGAHETVLVGERGIELFRPDVAGTVIPNREIRRAGASPSIVQNITINTPDVEGFRRSRGQIMADMRFRLDRAGQRNG